MLRFVIASAAGLAVAFIATVAAWQGLRTLKNFRLLQWHTQETFDGLVRAISAYQQRNNVLPDTLGDLRTIARPTFVLIPEERLDGWQSPLEYSADGANATVTLDELLPLDEPIYLPFHLFHEEEVLDGWRRPFEYSTDGTNYTVTSFGRDGKPGGVGLDCDLTNINPHPASSVPTLHQFTFGCRPTEGLVGTWIGSGLLTFVLSWFLARPTLLTRKKVLALCIKVMVTVVGAIIVACFLAGFHVSTGH